MAKETKEERRARIEKEVAERSAAREKAYFEAQEKSKAKATAAAAPLPQPDAYVYDYAWRQGVGTPEGELKLIKSPNPYYDASTNTIVDPATGERRPATQSMVSGASTSSDSLYDAKRAAGYGMDTQGNQYRGAGIQGDPLTINGSPFTGSYNGKNYVNGILQTPAGDTGYKVVNGILTFNGQPFTGTYNGQVYENGTVKASSGGNNQGGGRTVTRTEYIGDGANRILRTYYSDGTTSDSPAPITVASTANVMTSGQQDVYSIMLARLNQYNLGSLAPLIRDLAIKGATESTIMLQLSEEPLYKERFKANETRKQKGLSVLTPSQYLSLEDDYRQVLRAYGLTQFDNDAYVSQFLANDVSVSELSNRVVTAVQRVRNADPAVSNMLKNLYGIGQNDLVAYVLDPQQQFQKIERQVAASEISVAAARQGFNIGATVAEQLAAQGISQAEAQKGYATIADILPTAEKLSDIYGGQLESYRLAEGEQEVFNQLASAQRKRRALTERELASFSGQAGLGRTSLTQQVGGQF
jgi:hypothetical protein